MTAVEGAGYVAGCDSQSKTKVDEPDCREWVGRGLLGPEEGGQQQIACRGKSIPAPDLQYLD
jgi:hypothetical protein